MGELPANHPFITVGNDRFFWSSTTYTLNSDLAFVQNFGNPIGFGGENDRLLKCCGPSADIQANWQSLRKPGFEQGVPVAAPAALQEKG